MDNYYMQIGDIILDHFEVKDLIGQGGEGMTAKAIYHRSGQTVVIKHLMTSHLSDANKEIAIKRFKRGAQVRFNHPHIVDCIDYGEDDGQWFMIFPFIDGVELDKYISNNGGRLKHDEAIMIIKKLLSGFAVMHDKGFVHRDIKSQNIMIDQNGDPHIIDMGICKDLNANTITEGNGILGSLQFMAPEQLMDSATVSASSDIYSIGIVLYLMLTGQNTIPGDIASSNLINAIFCHVPTAPHILHPDIPRNISDICMKMLAKNSSERFCNCNNIIATIEGNNPQISSNICKSCHKTNPDNADYCNYCGAALKTVSADAICLACGSQIGENSCCSSCGRHFSPSNHRITFVSGPLTTMVYRIAEGEYYSGRNQLCERDISISRRHLLVNCINGTAIISDAGSSNGTFIAGQIAARPTPLINNCQITVARSNAIYTNAKH
ncbi:MAG: protein kinase [Phycisphaerae bacterium]|nr:protein kinase [Phycisphaerae bacterium]